MAAHDARLKDIMQPLTIAQLITLARRGIEIATPISAWNVRIALTILAQRLDKRSFVNVCEDISRGAPDAPR